MVNWIISGKTRLCGVIGAPVEHTMSPIMYNAAFKKLGLDYIYVPFRVTKEDLGKAIEGMRALNLKGLNVTIPHKVTIIQFLDELDPLAGKIGAVNTIVNNGGTLIGYNTDATGFLQALLERGIEPKGKNVVILGAGGASRAISFVLAERGANLVILNRTPDRAKECAGRISQIFQREVQALQLGGDNLIKVLEKADILVNTTSVGMSPNNGETLVTSNLIKPSLIVFDIVYNPIRTRLQMEAERSHAQIISGIEMLLWQGALAFEKWTGLKAPVELMRKEVVKALKKHEN
jgi:shikimate dehydrogenase